MHDIPMLAGDGVYNMVVEVTMMVIFVICDDKDNCDADIKVSYHLIPGAPMDKREDGD